MTTEPLKKKTTAFIDGQNLIKSAEEAFGIPYPNFEPVSLAKMVCGIRGWDLIETRFYTGVPSPKDNQFWHDFWRKKIVQMKRDEIIVYFRELRYSENSIVLPDKSIYTFTVGREKGTDIRIALDMVRLARIRSYDVALLFSQDQDFSEVVDEVKSIGREQKRWIKIASAYPQSSTSRNRKGVNHTDWIPFDETDYDKCLDPRNYHP